MKPDLSIIILSWNTKEILKKCLESIAKNNQGVKIELIIVDNGSTDGSQQYLKTLKNKNLKLILNKENKGFAGGNNQGISKAVGKYILLLNSDTIVKPQALARLVNHLNQNPKTAAASPMLLNCDGSQQIDYFMKFPNLAQVLLYHNILLRPIVVSTPLANLIFSKSKDGEPFSVDQIPGAALITRFEIFKKAGGLDEDFHFLFEDVDWCYRVKQKKLGELVVVPSAKIIHIGGASWRKWLANDRLGFYRHYFKSLLLFIRKHKKNRLKIFKAALKFSFAINGLLHLLTLNFKKARVQFQLINEIN